MRFWVAIGKEKIISTNNVKCYIANKINGKTNISESTLEKAIDFVYHPKDMNYNNI